MSIVTPVYAGKEYLRRLVELFNEQMQQWDQSTDILLLVLYFYEIELNRFLVRHHMISNDLDKLWKFTIGLIWIPCVVVVLLQFTVQFQKAHEYTKKPTYDRVDAWLDAGNCARKRGVLLAVCLEDGKFETIEDKSLMDDMGHSLLLGLVGKYTNAPINRETLVKINLFINLIGLAVIFILMIYGGFHIVPVVFALFGSSIVFTDYNITSDVTGSFYGVFAFALAFPLWLAISAQRSQAKKSYWLIFSVLAVLLIAAMLLRQSIGMIGVITAVVTLLLLISKRRKSFGFAQRVVVVASVLAVIILALQAGTLLVSFRSLAYDIGPGVQSHEHGVSHNLYIGLGTHDNPWGIKWNDSKGWEAAKAYDPDVRIGSRAYNDILLKLWWERVSSDPGAAWRIYRAKIDEVYNYKPPHPCQIPTPCQIPYLIPVPYLTLGPHQIPFEYQMPIGSSLLLLGIVAVTVWLIYRLKEYKSLDDNRSLIISVVFIFSVGFLAQGVLATPQHMVLYAAGLGNILIWTLVTEYALRLLYSTNLMEIKSRTRELKKRQYLENGKT